MPADSTKMRGMEADDSLKTPERSEVCRRRKGGGGEQEEDEEEEGGSGRQEGI